MAATISQLERAMFNAHTAGDTDAARKLAAVIRRERESTAGQPPEAIEVLEGMEPVVEETVTPQQDPTFGENVRGALEAVATMATGMTGGVLGQIEGSVEGILREIASGDFGSYDAADRIEKLAMERAKALTYEPRTERGAEMTQTVGETLAPLAAIPPLAEAQVIAGTAGRAAQQTRQAAQQSAQRVAPQVQQAAQEISRRVREILPPKKHPGDDLSMGAAQAPTSALRQSQADELPVPIRLTEGQRTRDFEAQRFERETAKLPEEGAPIRDRFEQQNAQLIQNMDAFIDATGAELTDLRGVGEIVDKALRNRAARDKIKIRTLYKDAEKSGEMEAPVSMRPLANFLNESVASESTAPILQVAKKELERLGGATIGKDGTVTIGARTSKRSADPFTGAGTVKELGGDQVLTLKDAEQLRKTINKNAGNDPTNIKFAAELKEVIDEITAGLGGDKYKQARQARAKYAQQYENVSLVKNLLGLKRGTEDRAIALEDVLRKSILDPSSPLDSMRQLRRLLQTKSGAEGKQAWKELQGATIRHIQEQMLKGVTTNQRGDRVVSPAQLDRVITKLDQSGKLDYLFGKKGAEQLRTINEVAKVVLTSPPGTVNHSNTATVLAGLMDVALTGATGVPAPIATGFKLITGQIKDAKLKAQIKKTLGEQ